MKVKYPGNVKTPAEKTAFLYRLQEKLRLWHNEKGEDFRNKTLSYEEWISFLNDWNELNDSVVAELLAARASLKADPSWNIDLKTVFE